MCIRDRQETRLDGLGAILFDVAGQIYPSDVIREHGDVGDWRNVVGTGPFELADYVEGTVTAYTRNPNYWGYDEKYPENRLPYVAEIRGPDHARRGNPGSGTALG